MGNPRFDTYIAVFIGECVRFVTALPARNVAEWKAGEPAKPIAESYAKDIVWGLTLNGYPSAVIKVLHGVELKNPEEGGPEK